MLAGARHRPGKRILALHTLNIFGFYIALTVFIRDTRPRTPLGKDVHHRTRLKRTDPAGLFIRLVVYAQLCADGAVIKGLFLFFRSRAQAGQDDHHQYQSCQRSKSIFPAHQLALYTRTVSTPPSA